jgi:hypothetical protein
MVVKNLSRPEILLESSNEPELSFESLSYPHMYLAFEGKVFPDPVETHAVFCNGLKRARCP